MKIEYIARIAALILVFGASIVILTTRWVHEGARLEVHAAMPENGGWLTSNITAKANEPLHLRLISDDVVHGFAIGQSVLDPVDILPGTPTDITLNFDQPGTYTFYCTRWCGANHWRMRGTITVEGDTPIAVLEEGKSPLYLDLGIDLDEPHDLLELNLGQLPSVERGEQLGIDIPDRYLSREYYLSRTPYQTWGDLRTESFSGNLNDAQVWDLVAVVWSADITNQSINVGQELYSQNCAACHGSVGRGDGVFALDPSVTPEPDSMGDGLAHPPDFTDPLQMYGASPALLQGKILRGGMGTGMPSWGQILSEDQTWALVDYLWTFSFQDLKE